MRVRVRAGLCVRACACVCASVLGRAGARACACVRACLCAYLLLAHGCAYTFVRVLACAGGLLSNMFFAYQTLDRFR